MLNFAKSMDYNREVTAFMGIRLDGNIGFIVNGAGHAKSTMDIILYS